MSKYNILVTGGAGFIGSHLVDALIERGHKVRILDSLVPQVHGNKIPDHLNKNAEFIKADICDADAIRQALDGIDVVYHQAAEVGVGQSMYEIVRYVRANDLGTAVLLEEMTKRPTQFKKLVVASSMSIYGEGAYRNPRSGKIVYPQLRRDEQLAAHNWELIDEDGTVLEPINTPEDKPLFPTSVYAVSKQDQEQYCLAVGRAYKIPTVALRYFNVYGTRQALSNPYTGVCAIFSARLLNDQPPLIFEDGNQTRDFVHVSDIVQANLLALESDKANYQAINIGTGRPTSVKQIAEMLAEGLGKKIQPEIVGKYREGDIRHCVADITKARNLLGYKPKVKLEDGLKELLEWVRNQKAEDMVAKATAELTLRNLVK
ncbi:MAG: NAD-dependent epimerase/dehydratase family protein [Pyrinomonadaceae bacterium]|nr:NAD-dependent epimerase/dehydratase family protein [Pyrinomonadaceae bacterium]MCX7639337.1 NAD-dependent epimerase/dehydratase family protein [Pyrinomonadaceae bacterium]MDW8305247.1 NAD-dependent epimerase/dehydratase family protein [Acidobacteriota bacterium]